MSDLMHTVPFDIEDQHEDVRDFQVPPAEKMQEWADQAAETWEDQIDMTDYIDHHVARIRTCKALADASKQKAEAANKIARGYLANVEYNRGLIEGALNAAVQRGLIKTPKVKAADYSAGIQDTAGSLEIDSDLDYWREELAELMQEMNRIVLSQVMQGAPIELDDTFTERLANFSTAYLENCGSVSDRDTQVFTPKFELSWDKGYIKQALKNGLLTDKLAAMFKTVKGKALTIRL